MKVCGWWWAGIESVVLLEWGGCWWPQKRTSGWPEETDHAAAPIIATGKAFCSQLASVSLSVRCTYAHLSPEYLKTQFKPSWKPMTITMNTMATTINTWLEAVEMEYLLLASLPGSLCSSVSPAARSGRGLRAHSPQPFREQTPGQTL